MTVAWKWSRVRLVLSVLSCEGLLATLRERLQFAPAPTPRPQEARGAQTLSLPRFYDYAGALHIHSTFSDGAGTVPQIARAANDAGLDFIVLSDHESLAARQNNQDGWRGRTLVLVGTEVATDTGHLLALDVPDSFVPVPHDAEAAQRAIADGGGIGFIALPCDLKDHWRDFARRRPGIGLEVFNLSAIARTKISLPALALIWRRYHSAQPQRAFHLVAARPARELRLWDSLMTPADPAEPAHPVVGIACLDAHAVMKFGRRAFPYPTYEEVFRTLRTHVLSRTPLTYGEGLKADKRAQATLADAALIHSALARGHCYMSYDNYADPTGFVFEASPVATGRDTPSAVMGDEVVFRGDSAPLRLTVQAPRTRSLVRLYCNGRLVAAGRGGRLDHVAAAPGAYRAEVFLYRRRIGPFCFGAKPWIFSNPIYVQPAPVASEKTSSAAGSSTSVRRR